MLQLFFMTEFINTRSKVIILLYCTSTFLSDHRLIIDIQYGFRPGVSTSDAISDLHHEILSNLDQKIMCAALS